MECEGNLEFEKSFKQIKKGKTKDQNQIKTLSKKINYQNLQTPNHIKI